MGDAELKQLLYILRAIADESRLKILGLVAAQERSVGELARYLDLKEPTVSHHLALMTDARLLTVRPEGTVRYYRLRPEALTEINAALMAPGQITSLVDDIVARGKQWAVDHFQRTRRLPKDSHQRPIVFRWLRDQFEADRDFAEAEVNETLGRYYSDYASLRRMMIERGYLNRTTNGVYRRGVLLDEHTDEQASGRDSA